ncbi:MAG: hypothetical protein LQ347_001830 [Umbilicaria vellea]|nr:MAG: hypothetical protein LQ347_001830 [Umbilicaria vellea]
MKKTPAVVNANISSVKMRKSGHTLPPIFGGKRARMSRLAMISRKRIMKPMMRVAQAKPTNGKSRCRSSGKRIPPTDPPVAANPVAVPLERRKKCPIEETAGVNIREVPMPPRMEKMPILFISPNEASIPLNDPSTTAQARSPPSG